MSAEMVATLRRGYEAFNRGDISDVIDLATADVEWGATGTFPGVEGLYRGPEAMQEWVDLIRSEWQEFEVTLGEILRDEDDVLVVCELLRGRGRSSHAEVEMRVFSVYWFQDGKIRKRQAFTERMAALEAAGLRE
jgi:ketosteroid isomerase-like protein